MSKGNTLLLAALGGAVVAVVLVNYLNTEKGRELLNTATEKLKELSGQATEFAKNNIGEIVRETKNSLGGMVKQKISEQVSR